MRFKNKSLVNIIVERMRSLARCVNIRSGVLFKKRSSVVTIPLLNVRARLKLDFGLTLPFNAHCVSNSITNESALKEPTTMQTENNSCTLSCDRCCRKKYTATIHTAVTSASRDLMPRRVNAFQNDDLLKAGSQYGVR